MKSSLNTELPARRASLPLCSLALFTGWQAQATLIGTHPMDGWALLAAAALLFVSSCRSAALATDAGSTLWARLARENQPWSRPWWILSVLAAVASLAGFAVNQWLGVAWLAHGLSIVLAIAAFWPRGPSPSGRPSAGRRDKWLLLVIIVAAMGARIWQIGALPEGLMGDEALYGIEARRILHEPGYAPLPYVESTQRPPHYAALVAVSFALFGDAPASIRYVSVAFGVLGIIAAYLLFNRWFAPGTHAGLIAAALLAAVRYDLTFSRIAIDGISTPCFVMLVLWLLHRGFAAVRRLDFVLAGITLGASMAFYLPMRIFALWLPAVGACAAALDAWRMRRVPDCRSRWRAWIPHLSAAAFGFALAAAPIAEYALREPGIFFERQSSASIFFEPEEPNLALRLINNTGKHLAMYNWRGPTFGRDNLPGAPLLDPISGTLIALGFALTITRWRERPAAFMLLLFAAMLQAGILSWDREAPNALRTLGALPAVVYFGVSALLAVQSAVWRWAERWRPSARITQAAWAAVLCALFAVIAWQSADTYFNRQMRNTDVWATHDIGATYIGRQMQALGKEPVYYIAPVYWQRSTIDYLAPGTSRLPWTDESAIPIERTDNRPAVLFLDYWHAAAATDAQRAYPGTVVSELRPPWGGPVYVYEVVIGGNAIRDARSR